MTKVEVLSQCTVEGNNVKLPSIQLDRALYIEVQKALQLIGGKWKGGKVQAFVFNQDPTELLNEIAGGESRNLKKEFQFFATPAELAERMVYLADIQSHDLVLEPSAGQGAIIAAINKKHPFNQVDCYELMELNRIMLKKSNLNYELLGNDFMEHNNFDKKYTKIIANPPFTKNQDIDHVLKMWECLQAGRIVTLMSQSWRNGSQKKQKDFRAWLEKQEHEIEVLPAGTFKESGTNIETLLITIEKR